MFAAANMIDYDALVAKYNSIWEQLQGVKIFPDLPERLKPAIARAATADGMDESAEEEAC